MSELSLVRPDISSIAQQAAQYQIEFDALKQALQPRDFGWYPYDSLGSLFTLDQLLTGESRYLLDLLTPGPILDLGCADGALAFFLESLGCRVQAFDNPNTNFNEMQGVRALRQALGSSIEIHEADLDTYFKLPERHYSAVFMFGILYHLKNPFYVLETLSRHSRYCFLTTRIARYAPDRTPIHEIPVGYLVDRYETNEDATNYWVFSEPGLRRLLDRTNWVVRDFKTVGNTSGSDPATWQGDERAFCLAERRLIDRVTSARLAGGWHELEEEGNWRWTERRFSAIFSIPRGWTARSLILRLSLPEAHIRSLGPITLQARLNGTPLPPVTYSSPGAHIYSAPVSSDMPEVLVEFELNAALPPRIGDARELGIIVSRLELN